MSNFLPLYFIKAPLETEFSFFTHFPYFLENIKIAKEHQEQYPKNLDLVKAKYKRWLVSQLNIEELKASFNYLKNRYLKQAFIFNVIKI